MRCYPRHPDNTKGLQVVESGCNRCSKQMERSFELAREIPGSTPLGRTLSHAGATLKYFPCPLTERRNQFAVFTRSANDVFMCAFAWVRWNQLSAQTARASVFNVVGFFFVISLLCLGMSKHQLAVDYSSQGPPNNCNFHVGLPASIQKAAGKQISKCSCASGVVGLVLYTCFPRVALCPGNRSYIPNCPSPKS